MDAILHGNAATNHLKSLEIDSYSEESEQEVETLNEEEVRIDA